jgi:hypothetical protein
MGGRSIRAWGFVAFGAFGAFGAGCTGGDPCEQVAALLRKCCDKGPVENQEVCEARASDLEGNGNSDACDQALQEGDFAGCDP